MRAFKGFTSGLRSVLGDGKQEFCQFRVGETKEVPASKTAKNGFHCCENPLECLTYYALNGKNRFFLVEAAGDIDEDAQQRIACTKITLIKELSVREFAMEGMRYMIEHPLRAGWEISYRGVEVARDVCEAAAAGHIAIARGKAPRVKGPAGSILGLIVETDAGIENAKLILVPEKWDGKWLGINEKREVIII